MADIMTRWMRGYRGPATTTRSVARIENSPSAHLVPRAPLEGASWPTRGMLLGTQQTAGIAPPSAISDDDGFLLMDGKVWDPPEADDLKLKLLTVAHAGQTGHRGGEATAAVLREKFSWSGITTDAKDFVANFLLCVLSRSGSKVPRPLSTTLHALKPNEVLHFDYLYLGEGTSENRYLFVLKDDFSGYAWLNATASASAAHAADVLARWQRAITAPAYWVSDQGTHFMNALLQSMARDYNIEHKPTVAYSLWVNGTVERLNRDILSALRVVIGELKLAPQDWPAVIDMITSILNEAPEECLGRSSDVSTRSPLQVMTGIRPRRAILQVITERMMGEEPNMDRDTAERDSKIKNLQKSLSTMHKDVGERVSARRQRAIDAQNAATNIVVPSFVVGDFVAANRPTRPEHKLSFRWSGPRRVVAVKSPAVCVVEDLLTQNKETVHFTLIKKYDALADGMEVPEEVLYLSYRTAARYEVVERIADLEKNDEGFWVRLQWESLPHERDYTWAPLDEIHEDIPDIFSEFLHVCIKKELATAAARHLGISL